MAAANKGLESALDIKENLSINIWRRNLIGIASIINGAAGAAYFMEGKVNYGVFYTSMFLVSGLFAYDSHLKTRNNYSDLEKHK